MNKLTIATKNTCVRLLLSASVVGLFSLGIAMPSFAKQATTDPETVIVSPPEHSEPTASLVKRFALMALFAKTAYRKDIKNKKYGCNYIVNPPNDLPQTLHWQRWDKNGACYNSGGLFFETYVHTNDQGTLDKAVISIRGTEFTSLLDWKANLSGMILFKNTEYTAAKATILPLISKLKKEGVKEIYLTGHSLGGGIAQEIAYLSSDVTATYTFNTSPVTNWVINHFKGDIKVKNPTVYRIYVSKEVLSKIRQITGKFNHELPNRIDYQFNFPRHMSALNAHAMSHLTCYFAERVMHSEDIAEFDYSKIDAEAVLNNDDLCPKGRI